MMESPNSRKFFCICFLFFVFVFFCFFLFFFLIRCEGFLQRQIEKKTKKQCTDLSLCLNEALA